MAVAVAASCILAACGSTTPGEACTEIAVPGIAVSVVDSATGDVLPPPSTVVAQDGAFSDTAEAITAPNYSLVYERKGTYLVTVTHDGYHVWQRSGVVVTSDACHVITVELTAKLQQ